MAPLILASALGLITGMRASATAEINQRLNVALTTATENVKAMPYLPCGTAEEYQKAYAEWLGEREPLIVEEHRSPAPRFVEVQYWDEASASYIEKCPSDGGAQRFTLAVAIDGRRAEGNIVTRGTDAAETLELRR